MMKKSFIVCSLMILMGCSMAPSDRTIEEPERYRPVRYDASEHNGHENDYGRMLQKEKLSSNQMDSYSDPTVNERTERITEELMKNRDIIMAEVHELDDEIHIALRLTDNNFARVHDENIIPDIIGRVRRIIGNEDKEIKIWTDHSEWKLFREEHSTPELLNIFNDFFETDPEND